MKENYFIIHGSFGSPYANWFPWLADYLMTEEKEVYVPDFPVGVGLQTYENWSKLLEYYLNVGLIHEGTTIIAHSIAPVFVCKFLVEHQILIKKLISVCGFNQYFVINEEYDTVNQTMYFDHLEDVKKYCKDIICFYTDNDPYVRQEVEEHFASIIATEKVLLPRAGHINGESGFDTFESIVAYL